MESDKDLVEEVMDKYREYISPGLARLMKISGYNRVEKRAHGSIVVDTSGKEFIDCGGGYGVFNTGHRHPKVVKAVKEQLELMPMSPRVFFSKPQAELAELLAEIAPGELKFSFFCNSGTEACEGAIKLARLYTKRKEVITAKGAFHGKTLGSLSASGRDIYKSSFEPLIPHIRQVPFDNKQAIKEAVSEKTAAVMLEPVQGEGGIKVPSPSYLPYVQDFCRKHGALFILDEVQTGLGRCGKMFAGQHFDLAPDIMTLAKALGGGVMPIGVFMGTPQVWEAFRPNPLIHTSTFGGNPLACRAAKAAIEVIMEEGLCAKSEESGKYLGDKLEKLKAKYQKYIAEVRGVGLMLGVEFAYEGIGGIVIPSMARSGITAIYTLNNQKVIRFEPPLNITVKQMDKVVDGFEKALEEIRTRYDHLFKNEN